MVQKNEFQSIFTHLLVDFIWKDSFNKMYLSNNTPNYPALPGPPQCIFLAVTFIGSPHLYEF
jgi:hypothetical protein